MKVILKENVKGVGRKFEVKEVSDGYANNFLIPKRLAEYASPEAVKKAEEKRAAAVAEIEIQEKLAQSQIEMLKDIKISILKKASDKGHLFEKIHAEEISSALKDQANISIDPEFLDLDQPIKEIGEHKVKVSVGKSRGEFNLEVTAA